MSSASGQPDIERVRDATDLVALIGEHVALRPKGREHVGLCPFHDDHTPSLAVVTHKGNAFYKCHACGAAGDAFTFVMEYHKKDFAEALAFLADRAGITLTGRGRPARAAGGVDRAELRAANALAATFFQRVLHHPEAGAGARAILAERGLSERTIDTFKLGLAPTGFTGYAGFLESKRGPAAVNAAAAAGLLKRRDDGSTYDAFRNRLIFPICDELGNPVAFGGRRIDPDDEPKYLNSSESPVFHKSRTLYGLDQAKREIIDANRAVVVEGYTDVLACHQAGLRNAVGTLGTAMTPEHARVLSRLCDTVVLVFDGDEAGQRAADRGVEVFFREPVDVRICVLPDGLDPDDLLRRPDGADRFGKALDEARDALEFKVGRFQAALAGVTTLAGREKLLRSFLQELAALGFQAMQGVRKRWVLTRLAELLGVSIADVTQALPVTGPARPAASGGAGGDGDTLDEARLSSVRRARRLAERDLLAVVIYDPAAAREPLPGDDGASAPLIDHLAVEDFEDPVCRCIAERLLPPLRRGGSMTVPELLASLEDASARAVASDLFFEGRRRCDDDPAAAGGAAREAACVLLDCIAGDRYRRQLTGRTLSRETPERQLDALQELIEKRRRHGDIATAITQGART